jgi:naphthalene 1,2-dioxygenase system ferredoxin subunit
MYFVTADMCSHGPGLLSDGYVDGFDIECPFHQGRFDLRTGDATLAPCTQPIKVWPVKVEGGRVFLNLG